MAEPDWDKFTDDSVLTDGHLITTTVTSSDGSTKLTSSLDLNTVVGNVNGVFSWGGTNFSNGAQNAKITDGYQLEADLPDNNGNLVHAIMYIGSLLATDSNGKPAIQHTAGVAHSTAHATVSSNDEANQALVAQAQTKSDSSSIESATTVKGDASTYWPDGNAPAAGSRHSRQTFHRVWGWIEFGAELIECFI